MADIESYRGIAASPTGGVPQTPTIIRCKEGWAEGDLKDMKTEELFSIDISTNCKFFSFRITRSLVYFIVQLRD